jgi:N-acetylglucosamine-6-phosphate deacetylase
MRVAIGTKAADRVAVITDGTAASGLPRGSRTRLGSLAITAADTARLDDGRPAGSVLTMDRAFANLVTICQYDLVEAARMCATTPARDLGLAGIGAIETGRNADLVVLRDDLTVEETWIRGRRVWSTAPD